MASRDDVVLTSLGIKAVVSVLDSECSVLETKDICTLHIEEEDSLETDLFKYFQTTCEFIKKNLTSGVLIHCEAGRSRSATIAAAFLIQNDMSFVEAITHLTKVRPCVKPNLHFITQLRLWEHECT